MLFSKLGYFPAHLYNHDTLALRKAGKIAPKRREEVVFAISYSQ